MDRTRSRLRRLAAGVCVLALMAGTTRAGAEEEGAGRAGVWLSQYASARTLGLGNAFVASADDPLGILWNPAGL